MSDYNLKKCFDEANRQQLDYVVINDDGGLPWRSNKLYRIIVKDEHRKAFIKIFELRRIDWKTYTRNGVTFSILPKSCGYFPETYCTKLFRGHRIVNDCVKVPDINEEVWIALHEFAHHGEKIDEEDRKILNAIERHVGKHIYHPEKVKYEHQLPD